MTLFFAGLIKFIGSAGFGTIFGQLMGAHNRKIDLQAEQLRYADAQKEREHELKKLEHELKQREFDLQIMDKEASRDIKVAEIKADEAADVAAFNNSKAAFEFAKAPAGSWVETFNAFVRPYLAVGASIGLPALNAIVFYMAFIVMKVQLTTDDWKEIILYVIALDGFIIGAAIGFYCQSRPGKMPKLQKAS